jgi:hypothetical protein
MGNRNRDLPACSIVPQSNTLPRAPYLVVLIEHNQHEAICKLLIT